jgi:hypothetical protein
MDHPLPENLLTPKEISSAAGLKQTAHACLVWGMVYYYQEQSTMYW